ncbi:hypothetical protein [Bacillus sp. NEB1478]|uniref:hypothetical protein n=1 Tax=Bacillus sp. NEB1478 TaxID=3073816 RepID=UPI00287348D9|nr:hypothetical protein [Bacillus sp. NEB1478]WNB90955.1 hypothetical protein RGB74_13690 [Bacillus sp. NEB1478]
MNQQEVLEIGANCILRLKDRFFLVFEVEADVPGVELEIFTIARIDKETARRLFDAGIECCEITNKVPRPTPDREVEFICIFIDRDMAFALFDVEEGGEDHAVFVKISLEEAKCAIRKGARHCNVVDAREHC